MALPAPKQNLTVVLLAPGGIAVTNSAGSQTLTQPYRAIRVERSGVPPTPPFPMEPAEARRLFGTVMDALPAPDVVFTLYYFAEGSQVLVPESQAEIAAILNAIRERHSTAISLIGHTDTTAGRQFNYRLGLRRARQVAAILRERGIDPHDLFVDSHGDVDLKVKTGPDVVEHLNRRVEVIVH